jgi:demethylmenaquinone methyltransferase / 2-methoxy-6-polyprenyl-1,4-benzoquinol methylase
VTARGLSARTHQARTLFAGIAPQYGWMGAVLSFGQDGRWRRFLASRIEARGAHVLDVASGTGLVARELVSRGHLVTQLDPSEPMLRAGVPTRRRAGRAETLPVVGRAEELPFPDATFDVLTVTYLLRYVDDPSATVRELLRVVRPGGTVASLEFHVPQARWARTLWRLYTRRVMPVVGGIVSRSWGETGRFLGPSIEGFYRDHPLAEQLEWWLAAGLEGLHVRTMSNGAGVVLWGTRR